MAIFAIADLHLSLGAKKPMDIFGGWNDYVQKLEFAWHTDIKQTDTIVIPGDVTWAMKLEECYKDFSFLHSLPGTKILLKGNHDYWWSTKTKMDDYLSKNEFNDILILSNNSFEVEGVSICGTRGWGFDDTDEHDEKLINRENGRLQASLQSATQKEKIVFLHYPPIYQNQRATQTLELLEKYNVKMCFYGHLHSLSTKNSFNGILNGIEFKLISADSLNFCPHKINNLYRNIAQDMI